MLDKIIDAVSQLIASIEEQRPRLDERRKSILAEPPSCSGMNRLDGYRKALERLRLAEDVLSDALTELNRIDDT